MFLWSSTEAGLALLDKTWAGRSDTGAARQEGGIVRYFRETPEDAPPLQQPSRDGHSAADGRDEDETPAAAEDGTT